MWTYSQATGKIAKDGVDIATGYSGAGPGKNNPAMQAVAHVGPIPVGDYVIGPATDLNGGAHGPYVLALTAEAENVMYGRDGFLIHGDSISHPGAASEGCIILDYDTRRQIATSGETWLEVVE